MLRARLNRTAACILIAAIWTMATSTAAPAQGAYEVEVLNQQVAQLYGEGKYAEAIPIAERALTLAQITLGKEHPNTLMTVNNLALLYQAQGRYDEAEALYKRPLAAKERVLGPTQDDGYLSASEIAVLKLDADWVILSACNTAAMRLTIMLVIAA
jgi:tetratricopeptide (TPR) repeat protein